MLHGFQWSITIDLLKKPYKKPGKMRLSFCLPSIVFSSLVASFQIKENRNRMGSMIQEENKHLTDILTARWGITHKEHIHGSVGNFNECSNRRAGRAGFVGRGVSEGGCFTALHVLFDFMTNEVTP